MTRAGGGIGVRILVLAVAILCAAGADAAPRGRKSSKPVRPAGDTTAVMAVIGGHALTRAMVEARLLEIPDQFRGTYETPQGRQQLIDRMVEEQVWLKAAEQSKVGERPDIKEQLERQRRDVLVRTYLNEEIAKAPAISDSAAQAYYDAHIEEYRTPANVTIQHILLRDERSTRQVRTQADRSSDWAKLVERYSTDSLTRSTAGALGTVTLQGNFASIGPQPALAESAHALGEGAIGGPWKTDRGWHVVKVGAVTPEGIRSLEQMKSVIVRQLGAEQQKTYYQELLQRARHDLGVKEDSAAIRGYVSMKKPPRELFEDAQKVGPADQRIVAYRRVVDEFPDAEVSPQALFMVGFIYSEELKQYDQAEAVFRELLSRYPQSELAESAKWMLENMKSDAAPPFAEPDGAVDAPPAASEGPKSP